MTTERYSHGHHESVLRSHRWRTAENSAGFLLPHLTNGMSILDAGCGPGNITVDLAARVGDGKVVGIDLSDEVIGLAKEQYSAVENVTFQVGDVYHLDFPDEHFDVVYAHQVLQHVRYPVAALEEMRRVLKPAGLLAVRDADYGAFIWSPTDPILDRWMELYHKITQKNEAQADAGRLLKTWTRAAGFDDGELTTSNWTYQSAEERAWWGGLWSDRVRHSEFATQGLEYGLTTYGELEEIAAAFERWASDPAAVFVVVNFEILARR
jgi:ubiquinone/menaquinone biosynthesis C-methylase UbiE